jgi:hypothetical protein
MKRGSFVVGLFVSSLGSSAYAAIPAGYMGRPFDPADAGGKAVTMGVKAGPYPVPGRLEFENHDMGGINIGFFTTDHIACSAAGYRLDDGTKEASLCLASSAPEPKYTAPMGDIWYQTGDPAVDGTTYPSATTTSIYIGAVRPGDWVNITVDVQTAGTYQVGSTWASGNGVLGLEGGNGAMELQVSVNGTLALDWKDIFPNYATTANFHHWKPYPNMGTIMLQQGLQVIKLDTAADPHLNLDYILLSLVLPDGGLDPGNGGSTGPGPGTGDGGAGADTGAPPGNDAGAPVDDAGTGDATIGEDSGATGGGTTGGTTTGGTGGTAGTSGTGATGTTGTTGATGATAGTGGPASEKSGCGCALPGALPGETLTGIGTGLALLGVILRRRRRAR